MALRKGIASLFVIALLTATVVLVAASTATAATAVTGKYCLTIVKRAQPGSSDLGVVSQACSDTAAAGTVLPKNVTMPASTQLLVIFHQDVDYGGAYDTVAGQDGPCDSSGYGFSDLTLVEFNTGGISSYQFSAGSNCHFADYWTGSGYTGTKRSSAKGDNPYVGAPWNDDIFSMKVRA